MSMGESSRPVDRSGDRRLREGMLDGFFAAQADEDAQHAAVLFELRAHGGSRSPDAGRKLFDLSFELFGCDIDVLAPRDLVEDDGARDGIPRRLALGLAEFLPVDVRLPGIDALLKQ